MNELSLLFIPSAHILCVRPVEKLFYCKNFKLMSTGVSFFFLDILFQEFHNFCFICYSGFVTVIKICTEEKKIGFNTFVINGDFIDLTVILLYLFYYLLLYSVEHKLVSMLFCLSEICVHYIILKISYITLQP